MKNMKQILLKMKNSFNDYFQIDSKFIKDFIILELLACLTLVLTFAGTLIYHFSPIRGVAVITLAWLLFIYKYIRYIIHYKNEYSQNN